MDSPASTDPNVNLNDNTIEIEKTILNTGKFWNNSSNSAFLL
jgi:hypothetical protein